MVSPGCANASNLLPVDPLLDGWEADPKLYRRFARFQQLFTSWLCGLSSPVLLHLEPNRTVVN